MARLGDEEDRLALGHRVRRDLGRAFVATQSRQLAPSRPMLLKHGKYQAAVELFQREVAARPDDAGAHNNLGAGLLLRGDVAAAIEEFERALRLNPGHEQARRNLAKARER